MTGAIAYLWWSSKNAVTNASLNQELKKTEQQLTTEINRNGQQMLGEISELKKFTCKASVLCLIQGTRLSTKIDDLKETTNQGFAETKQSLESLSNNLEASLNKNKEEIINVFKERVPSSAIAANKLSESFIINFSRAIPGSLFLALPTRR